MAKWPRVWEPCRLEKMSISDSRWVERYRYTYLNEAPELSFSHVDGLGKHLLLLMMLVVWCTWRLCCFVKDGYTALMLAAKGGHEEVCRLLLNRGATSNAADPVGVGYDYGQSWGH